MKAMILAAGKGMRVRPLTNVMPKPMIPPVRKPIMETIVDHLRRHSFVLMRGQFVGFELPGREIALGAHVGLGVRLVDGTANTVRPVCIGANCHLQAGAQITQSIIGDCIRVGAGSCITERIGKGVQLAHEALAASP